MIATTLGAISLAGDALARLTTLRLPAASAYHVARLARLVDVELAHVRAQRETAIKDCGTPRPATEAEQAQGLGPELIEVLPEQREAFNARMIELAAVPVTIAANRVELSLAALAGCAISAADLLALDPFVTVTDPTTNNAATGAAS